MSEWHADHDALVALALHEVEPAERERLSAHLAACTECRAEYATIEDGVSHTLAAAPAVAPPAGFSGRVLSSMGMEGAADTTASRPTAHRWRLPLLAAAAALVLGLALGIAGTLAVVTSRTSPAPAPTAEPAPPTSAVSPSPTPGVTTASALVTRDGRTVGSAGMTSIAGQDQLVISVTSARPGATYECVVVGEDGERTSAGTWTLDGRYGGEDASGTWVVEAPEGGVEAVELIAPSGTVWAEAEF